MSTRLMILLTGKEAETFLWQRGHLTDPHSFDGGDAGIAAFTEYLQQYPDAAVTLLTDLIEEDFHLDTLPHLSGRSHQSMLTRKLAQTYRTTPYRHGAVQGRNEDGRRDDQLLLSALTNPDILKPWIDAILRLNRALLGIVSVPLVSQPLIKKMGLDTLAHLLLITFSQDDSLRQSYLQNGQLKFSRRSILRGNDPGQLPGNLDEECTRLQQYLQNQRLLPRDQRLEIVVLCPVQHYQALQEALAENPRHHFRFVPLQTAFELCALPLPDTEALGSALFLSFLAKHRLSNQYATPDETRYWRLAIVQRALRWSAAGLLGMALLTASFDLVGIVDHRQVSAALKEQTQLFDRQRQSILNGFPPLPASPAQMREAVELADKLSASSDTARKVLSATSQALAQFPEIHLEQLAWIVSSQPDKEFASPDPAGADAAAPGLMTGEPRLVTLIEGDVAPFSGFREEVGSVTRFMAELKKDNRSELTALAMPIDTASQASLQGVQGGGESQAEMSKTRFKLKQVQAIDEPPPAEKP
ncbi:MAG: hypothetical protein K8F27_04820 [Sulfuricellaceae bacterium]|nr:hypothetical protein [Sulfuricellaceae bacterium]